MAKIKTVEEVRRCHCCGHKNHGRWEVSLRTWICTNCGREMER